MRKLGETKLKLKSTVIAVFIASEENSAITGVGVDALVKDGLLNKLKGGPLYWIDTADKQPCIGTGGMIPWKLHVTGKLFHSGLPHKAINPLELAMEALKVIQTRFYKDFPPHPKEQVYGFETPSTMKPTQWSYPGGGINQIPGECTVSGDVRLTPFYNVTDVMKRLQEYVDDINENIEKLDTRGPVSKYVLPDENIRGRHVLSLHYLTLGRDDFRIFPLRWQRHKIKFGRLKCIFYLSIYKFISNLFSVLNKSLAAVISRLQMTML
ncbi:hypothetical protein CISIN_1g022579mg [Citrus sinensis]|uniref:Peptidase M20 dimerisation domain-containing protein n=2 Tax=Citrus sinensis TaxID=2711 RepID=A0A067DFY4_CITSI|nr:hypothetical protein CISIN_1g022579mg [Citrus sinensis]KDO40470.1 hypothetical protein CISIN_1g022579mg [Citrus sinensis]